jgi:asparagine synthase (glutamine-hydrolysing)
MWGGAERELLLGAAVASGTRVLLTGEVADNCVSGSRQVFDSLIRQRSLGRLVRHLRAYRRVTGEFPLHTLARDGLLPLLPIAWQTSIQTHQMRRLFERDRQRMLPSWMPESLRSELSEHVLRICLDEVADRRYRSPAREAEYRLLYPPEVTRQFAPWPVEFRRPFADRRLHEFLLAIPPDQKFEPHPDSDAFYAGSKWLVRRALRGILPESVRTRTGKTVFNDAFSRELSRNWPGYVAAFGPGTRPHIAERGYIRREPFFQRLETLRQGAHGPDVVHVVRLVELETWLRAAALPRPRGVQVSQPRSVLTPATREDNVRADGR